MLAQVDHLSDLKAKLIDEPIENVGATLGAPIGCLHGIQHDSTIRMEAHPVVRKYRIGCMWLGRVIDNHNIDACGTQCVNQGVKFFLSRLLLLLRC